MLRWGAVLLIVATIDGLATRSARAFDGGLPWFGYGYSGSLYGLGYLPVPPYFAVHPPVQYSHPTAFPYGRSPYASRANREFEPAPVARLVMNPFARDSALPARSSGIIINPYVKADR